MFYYESAKEKKGCKVGKRLQHAPPDYSLLLTKRSSHLQYEPIRISGAKYVHHRFRFKYPVGEAIIVENEACWYLSRPFLL